MVVDHLRARSTLHDLSSVGEAAEAVLTLRELVTDQVQLHPWSPTAIIATSFASADRGEHVERPEGWGSVVGAA
jgi:hypothetical protein